jgi:hypothetical protein
VGGESSHRRRLARATRRLSELKAMGVKLSELLDGEAGASFIHDDCDGDVDLAYEALALVFYPTVHKRRVEE